jgi:hypothetical protein
MKPHLGTRLGCDRIEKQKFEGLKLIGNAAFGAKVVI